jgi:hypothetical protein
MAHTDYQASVEQPWRQVNNYGEINRRPPRLTLS